MDETEPVKKTRRRRLRRRLRLLLVLTAALVLLALVLLFITAPDPTILRVRVLDASTGRPLYGAMVQVQSRGAQPLPAVTTDEDGMVRFRNLPPASTYVVRVQQADYDLVIRPQVAVPGGQTTTLDVPLDPDPGGRLYVGLDGTRLAEIDTASLLPLAAERLTNSKQGSVSQVRVHPDQGTLYTVTTAERPGRADAANLAGIYDEIDVLRAKTKVIQGRVEVEGTVHDIALSADGRRLLALVTPAGRPATLDQAKLLVIDATSGHLLTSTLMSDLDLTTSGTYFVPLPADTPPESRAIISSTLYPAAQAKMLLTPDGSAMYVLHSNEPKVWEMDAGARRVLDSITVQARPQGGALSADGRSLYAWATDRGFTLDFPFPTNTLLVPGSECPPEVTATGSTVTYTLLAPSVLVGENGQPITATSTATGTMPVPGERIMARYCVYFNPLGRASTNGTVSETPSEQPGVLLTIDTARNVTRSRQDLPPGTTALAVSPVNPELYVLNGTLGTLSILPFDGTASTVIAVGSDPVALAVSTDGKWAYVANRGSRSVSAVYLPAAAVIQTIPLDGVPFSVALR